MAAFSSDPEVSLNREVNISSPFHTQDFINGEDQKLCLEWIRKGGYKKVCLQFPDYLLVNSFDIALFIERQISQKVYILGDTSYGSCCVDEVAAEHVEGDAIVHFGDACLSPVDKLPVYFVFPKEPLDVENFFNCLLEASIEGPLLLLYHVAYSHKADELWDKMPEEVKGRMAVSRLECVDHSKPCSTWCHVSSGSAHKSSLLSRTYCPHPDKDFSSIIYLGEKDCQNLNNIMCSLKGKNFLIYKDNQLLPLTDSNPFGRSSYLVERLKDAQNIGLLAGTLGVKGYLEAIDRVKKLCQRHRKKVYIIVVGKPSPAKLANFPEMDIFVAIACPEANFGNRKDFMQPIVTLTEVELAFNENRNWDSPISKDFRDLLPGGNNYVPIPEGDPEETSSVSLVSNKAHGGVCTSDSTDLVERPEMQVGLNTGSSFVRTWSGLDRALGETEVKLATEGRSGLPVQYSNEPQMNDKAN